MFGRSGHEWLEEHRRHWRAVMEYQRRSTRGSGADELENAPVGKIDQRLVRVVHRSSIT